MDSSSFTSHLRPTKREPSSSSIPEAPPDHRRERRRRESKTGKKPSRKDCETVSLPDEDRDDDHQQNQLTEEERALLEIRHLNPIPESLGRYSIRATTFHFAQAAILFYFASRSDTKWRWFTNYPAPDGDLSLNAPPQRPHPEEVADFSILWYSPIFICLAGCEHLSCLIWKNQYHYYIARSQNPFRWTEYTFSASLMRVMVAQFAGITDVHLLLVTFCLSALTMQLGSAHEIFNAKARSEDRTQNWICYYLAWVSQGISWAIIFNFFAVRVQQGTQPTFIWAIMIVMFLLDSSFALVFYMQWKKIGIFADYTTGEHAFIVLSFFAKTLLAWIGFGGVYRRY